ncbi:serine/threonine protein kinase, partial [Myxococcota bacterium]|nr:serine/threonine protein kinase [Myxococcota bacterium]
MSGFPRSAQLIGSIIDDRFEILEKLGEGGMGAIYKARQISMDRIVTLKVLLRSLTGDPISAEQFRREAYLASRLRHPNTIIIHEFGQAKDGLLYIAMEYLEGHTLKDRIKMGVLDIKTSIKIIVQILKALSEAHKLGIVHRDIKPENIFLTELDGNVDFVKVLDFGIAQLSNQNFNLESAQNQQTLGTPYYMSPEQIRGKAIDGQADIYSIGVLFYEMLVGNTPFHYNSSYEIMVAHLQEQPEPLCRINAQIDGEIDQIILKALEKDRRLRHASADALLGALERYLAQREMSASQPLQVLDGQGLYEDDEEAEDEATLVSNVQSLMSSPEMLGALQGGKADEPPDESLPEGLFDDDLMGDMGDDFTSEKTVLEEDDDDFEGSDHTEVGGEVPYDYDQSFNVEALDFLFEKEQADDFQPVAVPKIPFGQRPAPSKGAEAMPNDDEATIDQAALGGGRPPRIGFGQKPAGGFGLPGGQGAPATSSGLNLSLPKIKLPTPEDGLGPMGSPAALGHGQPRRPQANPSLSLGAQPRAVRLPTQAQPNPPQPAQPQQPPQFAQPAPAPRSPQLAQPQQAPQFAQPQQPQQAPQFAQPQQPQQAPQFAQPQQP